jgi:hypothetical protein
MCRAQAFAAAGGIKNRHAQFLSSHDTIGAAVENGATRNEENAHSQADAREN